MPSISTGTLAHSQQLCSNQIKHMLNQLWQVANGSYAGWNTVINWNGNSCKGGLKLNKEWPNFCQGEAGGEHSIKTQSMLNVWMRMNVECTKYVWMVINAKVQAKTSNHQSWKKPSNSTIHENKKTAERIWQQGLRIDESKVFCFYIWV